jgi:hypothetical protein
LEVDKASAPTYVYSSSRTVFPDFQVINDWLTFTFDGDYSHRIIGGFSGQAGKAKRKFVLLKKLPVTRREQAG